MRRMVRSCHRGAFGGLEPRLGAVADGTSSGWPWGTCGWHRPKRERFGHSHMLEALRELADRLELGERPEVVEQGLEEHLGPVAAEGPAAVAIPGEERPEGPADDADAEGSVELNEEELFQELEHQGDDDPEVLEERAMMKANEETRVSLTRANRLDAHGNTVGGH